MVDHLAYKEQILKVWKAVAKLVRPLQGHTGDVRKCILVANVARQRLAQGVKQAFSQEVPS
jgi:hypothetical protein